MKYLLITVSTMFACIACIGQDISGKWQGYIAAGGQKIPLVFNISRMAAGYAATMDSPAQNAFGLVCDQVIFVSDSLSIDLNLLKGGFKGRRIDSTHMDGTFSQGPMHVPMVIERIAAVSALKPASMGPKPQTPTPPFDYMAEDVTYHNSLQNITLAGTFTKPKTGGKFPVVILITGSGAQDRDETIGKHKPFLVLADYLTKHGIAVLRVDDRGFGKSTGNFLAATSADFATDVMAGIDYLKTRNDIDTTHIGLMGHSEGGFIAPYVAARRKDIAFIVMLAGPASGGQQTMYYQAVEKGFAQVSAHDRAAYGELYKKIVFGVALNADAQKQIPAYIRSAYFEWKKQQPDSTVKNLIRVSDEDFITGFTSAANDLIRPWWSFLLTYDLTKDIQKLKIPVLALNGEKDEQVDPKANLVLIKSILTKNKNTHFKVYEVPGVNHLFQHCTACGSVKEYMELEETFDPATLTLISNWINAQVK